MAVWDGAAAQAPRVLDEGELEVREAGRLVGREAFQVRQLAGPDGQMRLRLTVSSWYPARAGAVTLVQTVELGADSLPRTVQVDQGGEQPRRFLASFSDRRITVRVVTQGTESGREYPGGRRYQVADDSSLALFAVLPLPGPERITLFHARTGRRAMVTADGPTTESVTVAGRRVDARHVVLRGEEGAVHLWYDAQGRLLRVARPDRQVIAERVDLPGG